MSAGPADWRGPLEDSEGFPGYEDIVDALADPTHPDHAEYSAWVAEITEPDEPFDPAFLEIPAFRQISRALPRVMPFRIRSKLVGLS
jgi:hypothetical protein